MTVSLWGGKICVVYEIEGKGALTRKEHLYIIEEKRTYSIGHNTAIIEVSNMSTFKEGTVKY